MGEVAMAAGGAHDRHRGRVASDRRGMLGVFLLVWLCCAWFGSWELNPNNSTRLFAAISLVEDGDATIDDFAALTIDKAMYRGHAVLDKAPGMTLMALPAVWAAQAVTGDTSKAYRKALWDPDLARFLRLRTRLVTASVTAVLTALAAALLYDLALALTGSAAGALAAALGYALGTPVWGWSTTLFGHAAVAALYVVAVWAVWRATTTGSWRVALVAGAMLGWSVVVEYQAVLAGSAIGVWALWRAWHRADRWRLIGAAAVGGASMGVPLIAYNLIAYGTAFHLGYQDVVGWEGMHQGLFGLTRPRLLVLNELLFGTYRGLLWVAPAMLPAAFGLRRLVRDPATRDVGIMAVAVVVIAFLVASSYVYWDGGNATGPRIAMPMAGLLALGLAPLWTGLRSAAQRGAIAAVLMVSIALNAMIAAAEIVVPPQFRFALWNGVIKARFLPGDLRTWPSEWLGWTPWHGFALWAAIAVPLGAALAVHAARWDRGGVSAA